VPRGESGGRTRRIRGLRLEELAGWLRETLSLPPFRARQIFAWLHARGATDCAEMTDLSRELRERLAAEVELAPLRLDAEQSAPDGTRKLRLRCGDGAAIETVLIPEEGAAGSEPPGGKLTQCLSSQVGCGLGCRFCATATMGLRRNLTIEEIVEQVYRARGVLGRAAGAPAPARDPGRSEASRISNLVVMGMGEPMQNLDAVLGAIEILCTDLGQNFSPRRITISTAGVVPGIDELGRRAPELGLAVSLNATVDGTRSSLMPVNRRWPLAELCAALRRYPLPRRRRITIEYVLIAGVNDSPEDARRLPRLLDRIPVKVNLIPYNPARDDAGFRPPTEAAVEAFAERLREKGLPTYLRRSRGAEIAASCGQLAVREAPTSSDGPGRS
jgi:23S rRNA (adenine2503-C2)-methyltransferase